MTEEKVRVMQSENELTIARFEGRGRGHAPRNAGGLQKPEKTGNGGFFPWNLQKGMQLLTPKFHYGETHIRLPILKITLY